ncbi:hypothetical protein [Shewanella sp. MBTL60-007]|uniref:hypothetical protein n=1 Tax=Shewanella sp. MBTL60-007 TaxID=2815911 RepID=UPI001BC7B2E0|nr:hypothetical protein [Shewanella sp. MBTL60-007]GIU17712.1 hypothetical protein TUM3792_12960 [Shewanella sp. MBTL60-007]
MLLRLVGLGVFVALMSLTATASEITDENVAIDVEADVSTHVENPFIGSWKLVSGRYLDGKGNWIDYSELKLEAIKVISAKHFSFTTIKNVGTKDKPKTEFWAAGTGHYEYTASDYVEYPELNSFGVKPNTPFSFSYVIEGDEWRTERIEDGELKEQEVWHRLD